MTSDLNLIESVSVGDLERVKFLLNQGAAIDEVDGHGNTALWRAVFDYRGDGALIELLLDKGADPDHKNKANTSPRELAHTIANYDVRKYFPHAQ